VVFIRLGGTGHSLLVLLPSSLGKGYGNLGHWANAKPLFGWLSRTATGQRIGYKKEDYLIRPLCDQEHETVQHLLTSCLFARQFWFSILQPLGLTNLVPSRRSISLTDCGRNLGEIFLNNTKRVSILWSFLEHGSSGNIGTLVFLMGLLPICSVHSWILRMNGNCGSLQVRRVLLPLLRAGWLSRFEP